MPRGGAEPPARRGHGGQLTAREVGEDKAEDWVGQPEQGAGRRRRRRVVGVAPPGRRGGGGRGAEPRLLLLLLLLLLLPLLLLAWLAEVRRERGLAVVAVLQGLVAGVEGRRRLRLDPPAAGPGGGVARPAERGSRPRPQRRAAPAGQGRLGPGRQNGRTDPRPVVLTVVVVVVVLVGMLLLLLPQPDHLSVRGVVLVVAVLHRLQLCNLKLKILNEFEMKNFE